MLAAYSSTSNYIDYREYLGFTCSEGFLDLPTYTLRMPTFSQIQMEQTFTPGITFSLLVRQQPDWEHWLLHFNSTASYLLSRVRLCEGRGGQDQFRGASILSRKDWTVN